MAQALIMDTIYVALEFYTKGKSSSGICVVLSRDMLFPSYLKGAMFTDLGIFLNVYLK